jgi:hypothetical protein
MRSSRTFAPRAAFITITALLAACGGSSDTPGTHTSTVSAYVTDDFGDYDSVKLKLNTVQLVHTDSDRTCTIIDEPLPVDAAELGRDAILEYVDTSDCEAGPYNRLHVELDKEVTLTPQPPTDSSCMFVSYYDDASLRPNRLACADGTCSLDITGAVNLIAGNHEHVALDVDLKEFTVAISETTCEVTLKVSPLHAQGMGDKLAAGYRKSISGLVSAVDIGDDRFTLSKDGQSFTVEYDGVTDQPGLDELLTRAADDGLRTRVRCLSINDATTPPTCVAQSDMTQPLKAIAVKAEGTVSNLDPIADTLDLTYDTTTLPVNYQEAVMRGEVKGTLADGVTAQATLYGINVEYLAREVEVEE